MKHVHTAVQWHINPPERTALWFSITLLVHNLPKSNDYHMITIYLNNCKSIVHYTKCLSALYFVQHVWNELKWLTYDWLISIQITCLPKKLQGWRHSQPQNAATRIIHLFDVFIMMHIITCNYWLANGILANMMLQECSVWSKHKFCTQATLANICCVYNLLWLMYFMSCLYSYVNYTNIIIYIWVKHLEWCFSYDCNTNVAMVEVSEDCQLDHPRCLHR